MKQCTTCGIQLPADYIHKTCEKCRALRRKKPSITRTKKVNCSVSGCNELVVGHKMCDKHRSIERAKKRNYKKKQKRLNEIAIQPVISAEEKYPLSEDEDDEKIIEPKRPVALIEDKYSGEKSPLTIYYNEVVSKAENGEILSSIENILLSRVNNISFEKYREFDEFYKDSLYYPSEILPLKYTIDHNLLKCLFGLYDIEFIARTVLVNVYAQNIYRHGLSIYEVVKTGFVGGQWKVYWDLTDGENIRDLFLKYCISEFRRVYASIYEHNDYVDDFWVGNNTLIQLVTNTRMLTTDRFKRILFEVLPEMKMFPNYVLYGRVEYNYEIDTFFSEEESIHKSMFDYSYRRGMPPVVWKRERKPGRPTDPERVLPTVDLQEQIRNDMENLNTMSE